MQALDLDAVFHTEAGRALWDKAERAIKDHSMTEALLRGVLVGLSGGADSVMLLLFLLRYRRAVSDFPILAVHVNHCIRGEEADRDEEFSRSLCESLGVEFLALRYDIPSLAEKCGKGLEEMAREVRYSCFAEIISGRNDISTIAVAHNSTDNLETVLLNILRGAGARGGAGVPPVRDNIVRPLISCDKGLILSALSACGVPYVTDSTNLLSDYKRNFIRNEILPTLRKISDHPEEMFTRFSVNLRNDETYLCSLAEEIISDNEVITNKLLISLPESLFSRVLSLMCEGGLSESLISDIRRLLSKDNFKYSVGAGKSFVCERGACRVVKESSLVDFTSEITYGKNILADGTLEIILSNERLPKSYLNVYKISIQHELSSAIINGSLSVRSKCDGDSIFYGGMTRKLKKLFSDRKIPVSKRDRIPILCDESGVLCVPGYGVREDGVQDEGKRDRLFVVFGVLSDEKEDRLYIGSEFRS